MSGKGPEQNSRRFGRPRRTSKHPLLKRRVLRDLRAARRKVRRLLRRQIRRQVRTWMAFVVAPSKRAFLKQKIFEIYIHIYEEQARLPALLRWVWVRRVGLSVRHLHGPRRVAYGLNELVVVCLVRNGRPYIKSFIDHYLPLGVKHIVFLDNDPDDDTVAVAQEDHERVTVLQTKLPFKKYVF